MFHPWTNGEPAAADAVLDITTQAGLDQVRARILREQWAAAQTLTAVLLGRAFQAFYGEAACGPEGETSSEPSLRALLPEDVNTVPTGDVADRHQGPTRYADQAAARVCQTGRPLGCGLKTPPGAWTGRSRLRTSLCANPLSPRDRSSRSLVRIPADPWVAIRQAYETTPISFRRLAPRTGSAAPPPAATVLAAAGHVMGSSAHRHAIRRGPGKPCTAIGRRSRMPEGWDDPRGLDRHQTVTPAGDDRPTG